jgi:hypothetical protein
MKKGYIYILVAVFTSLLAGCTAKLQTYDLNEEYATSIHYKGTDDEVKSDVVVEEEKSDLVGVPVLSFYNGDLKRGGIWWAGKDIYLEKGDTFIIDATNVGPDSIPFGATFPPVDLVKVPVMLKVTARAEGKDGALPTLYMQVDDADGRQANGKRPFNQIENSGEFKEYYFDLKDIYVQTVPKKQKVNGAMINSLKFFINPGQSGFTGQIFITEIKVVPAPTPVKP